MIKPKKTPNSPRDFLSKPLVEIDEATFNKEGSQEEISRNTHNESVKVAAKAVKRLSSDSIAEIEKQVACSGEKVEITLLEEDNQSIELDPPSTRRRNQRETQQRKYKSKTKKVEGDEGAAFSNTRH